MYKFQLMREKKVVQKNEVNVSLTSTRNVDVATEVCFYHGKTKNWLKTINYPSSQAIRGQERPVYLYILIFIYLLI
jgi:hypothetical protein